MNLDLMLLFRIAGIGLVISLLNIILKLSGKDDIAMLLSIAGLITVVLMVLNLISQLFETVKTMFMF